MKIGIIGDIHANIDALRAVLAAFEQEGVEQILCTGDVVGYGASPCECIDLLRERNIPTVKGNHDEYVTQIGADWRIRPDAKAAILWTQGVLTDSYMKWLTELPRILHFKNFAVLHSSHVWSPQWPYVTSERAAINNFMFQDVRISFNGHSHLPLCISHEKRHRPRLEMLRNMFMPRKRRLLIGVGSVGQPRDGDPRSCCVIYDTSEMSLRILRVPYDIAAAQKRIRDAGLPADLADRLLVGH